MRNETVLRGFLAVEDGAAGTADCYAVFDFLRADGAFRERLGIVQPWFFQLKFARGAPLEVGDEHGIAGAFPFEVGSSNQTTLKLLETAPRIGKFAFGGRFAGG